MNNFGVRHYKVTKVKLITIIMNIIKKNQFIILLTIMSLFSITSLSTILCYKVKLDNYNKDNINEKTYIENDEYCNKPMEYFKNAEWKQKITDCNKIEQY